MPTYVGYLCSVLPVVYVAVLLRPSGVWCVCVSPQAALVFLSKHTHTHRHTHHSSNVPFILRAPVLSFFAFDLRSLFIAEDFNVHQLSALRTQLSFVTAR